MSLIPKIPHVLYGGDYNPEQWPQEVWGDDVRLMREAGVNIVTVGVFSWSLLEPRPGEYEFDWLDRLLNLLHQNGIYADLATATASPPPWLAKLHPESLPVTRDGVRLWPGSRQQYCPSSSAYLEAARALVERLAQRYGEHPAVALWHVNNEYGCHVPACYCDCSAAQFRRWLQARHGSLEVLNEAWGTAFWSQRYGDWDEIQPPRAAPAFLNPSQELDWQRFCSDALLELFLMEREILERHAPGIPITTNFMSFFKHCDYWKWARHVDFVADDEYPDPAEPSGAGDLAAAADLMRSLGNGAGWMLMEQAVGAVNWLPRNVPKHPGQMRLGSYQVLAHGAEGILLFQWRASRFGAEQFVSSMVPHAGTTTRAWREVAQLGKELAQLDAVLGTQVEPEVALLFDWESWWALEVPGKPSRDLLLPDQIKRWYRAFWQQNIAVDFAHPEADLSRYRLVVAPSLYLLTDTAAQNLERFVAGGGTAALTFFSGIVDSRSHVRLGGYPAPLRKLLGIVVQEFWPHPNDEPRPILLSEQRYTCEHWSDWIELAGAEVVASFADGWLEGRPAVTRNGGAWYVGTQLDPAATAELVTKLTEEARVAPTVAAPPGVEAVRRSANGRSLLFLLNHGAQEATVELDGEHRELLTGVTRSGTLVLDPFGVAVLSS
ncbi:MAG: beta-galactosidase [Gaiellaceae bacterium]